MFWTISSGLGLGPTRSAMSLVVKVVNNAELATSGLFDDSVPTSMSWAGCQRVAQRVHR